MLCGDKRGPSCPAHVLVAVVELHRCQALQHFITLGHQARTEARSLQE